MLSIIDAGGSVILCVKMKVFKKINDEVMVMRDGWCNTGLGSDSISKTAQTTRKIHDNKEVFEK